MPQAALPNTPLHSGDVKLRETRQLTAWRPVGLRPDQIQHQPTSTPSALPELSDLTPPKKPKRYHHPHFKDGKTEAPRCHGLL